ncbi:MAG: ATP-binding cassette domain-containing protein, partial [Proteobacteria bacterium]|nr:ATP-binding cassette domain-containing protein [Pseudomonadota bacterium]
GDATSQIIFDGRDITKLSATERAIAGIFLGAQNVPEISGLSVMSFLKHSLSAHAAAAGKELSAGDFFKQLITARERLNIPESWLSRSINVGFSGGERKRLMMLRLILIRPKLAILDEPDSGVDAETQKLFAEIIHEMNCPPTETLRISTPPKGGVISESERLPPWGESQSASKAKRDAPGPNKIEDFVGWAVGGQTTFLIISHQEKFTEIVAPTAITTLEHGKVVV